MNSRFIFQDPLSIAGLAEQMPGKIYTAHSIPASVRVNGQAMKDCFYLKLILTVRKSLPAVMAGAMFGIMALPSTAQDQASIESASQSFKFIANTLQTYRRSGTVNEEIGVPADRLAEFIGMLQTNYEAFTQNFRPDSSFCNFYHAPNNAIMEIEERAGLAFRYLPSLSNRLERYLALDQEFARQVGATFGDSIFEKIQRLRPVTASFEYLPVTDMQAGDMVNFADTACR